MSVEPARLVSLLLSIGLRLICLAYYHFFVGISVSRQTGPRGLIQARVR